MNNISAQFSLYPLGEPTVTPTLDKALQILRRHGLDVEVGAMSSLVCGSEDVVFVALQSVFREVAAQGRMVMVATFSNACPSKTD